MGDLLLRPSVALAVAAVGAVQVLAAASGRGGLPCPLKTASGWPCPGCGLSRACAALLSGDWAEALRLHALSPLVLASVAGLATLALLPGGPRRRAAEAILDFEASRAIPLAALMLLIGYWLLRLSLGWRG